MLQDLSTLEGKTLAELREIGKVLGITDSALKKKELLDRIKAIATESIAEENASEATPAENEPAVSEPAADAPKKRGRRPRMNSLRIEENKPASELTPESTRIIPLENTQTTTPPAEVAVQDEPTVAIEVVAEEKAEEKVIKTEKPAEAPQPKRRCRKPKAAPAEEESAENSTPAGEG